MERGGEFVDLAGVAPGDNDATLNARILFAHLTNLGWSRCAGIACFVFRCVHNGAHLNELDIESNRIAN